MAIYPSRTDIITSMQNPLGSFKITELIGGSVVKKGARIIQYSGGYTTVFPFFTRDSRKVAVRCWIADIGNAKERSEKISTFLNGLNSEYFCDFRYYDDALLVNGKHYPVVIMDWMEGDPLKEFINKHISSPETIRSIADKFREMVAFFHKASIAHGDLQHGNILVKPDNNLVVIDYDSMYIETLSGMSDTIKGLPGYQHPGRAANKLIHTKLDYFSELVIYLSLLVFASEPDVWTDYYATEDLLFSKDDFANPATSELMKRLAKSTDNTIASLTQKLQQQLWEKSIEQLLPLEELLIDRLKIVKDNITGKWDKQPNPPAKKEAAIPDPHHILNKIK